MILVRLNEKVRGAKQGHDGHAHEITRIHAHTYTVTERQDRREGIYLSRRKLDKIQSHLKEKNTKHGAKGSILSSAFVGLQADAGDDAGHLVPVHVDLQHCHHRHDDPHHGGHLAAAKDYHQ